MGPVLLLDCPVGLAHYTLPTSVSSPNSRMLATNTMCIRRRPMLTNLFMVWLLLIIVTLLQCHLDHLRLRMDTGILYLVGVANSSLV